MDISRIKDFLVRVKCKCFAEIIAMVTAVQKFLIFPPKNLEKYGRPKYACAAFFKKKYKLAMNIVGIYNVVVVHLLILKLSSL